MFYNDLICLARLTNNTHELNPELCLANSDTETDFREKPILSANTWKKIKENQLYNIWYLSD